MRAFEVIKRKRYAVYFFLALSLNGAAATTQKSDSELSRALIGTWEGEENRKSYPFIKSFISFNSNGTFKFIAIADLFGQRGREEYEGKWLVTDGRLIREIWKVTRGIYVGCVPTGAENISLQGNIVILHSKDGEEKLRRADIPTELPPLLPRHWMDKFIIQKTAPEYPIEARRLYMQGAGAFQLFINQKTGAVDSVLILKSTNHRILDEAAIRAFKTWRFKPGTMRAANVPIMFSLTRG